MSSSFSISESASFTVTHARHMAAKVATDLKRMKRLYGQPDDGLIADFEEEAIALLNAGYLGHVWYGYRRNGAWIPPALKYTAQNLYGETVDDSPGKIPPGANISGAEFHSFLIYSAAWGELTSADRAAFRDSLPLQRATGSEPSIDGYLLVDRTYSSGGRSLERAAVRIF